MASFKYLWKNRARFPITTKAFYAAWAKRLLTSRGLYKRNQFRNKLIRTGAKIHDTAEICKLEVIGKANKLSVGKSTFIAKCSLMLHEHITIGNNVCINEGCRLITASHSLAHSDWHTVSKPIIVEDFAWIATEALIMPGVTIGKGAVVGARAVVSKDVPPFSIVAGNPAKIINKKRTEDLRYNPCHFLAGNQAWLKG